MTFKDYILSLSDSRTTERTLMIEKIAEECGVHTSTVYKWMNGTVALDKLKKEKISEITGLNIEELFASAVCAGN